MSAPLPLMIVVYVIGTIVALIIIETIYTIVKSIMKKRLLAKPPLSTTAEEPQIEL
jgi:uncharacterized protein YneF (UPF0154 family)